MKSAFSQTHILESGEIIKPIAIHNSHPKRARRPPLIGTKSPTGRQRTLMSGNSLAGSHPSCDLQRSPKKGRSGQRCMPASEKTQATPNKVVANFASTAVSRTQVLGFVSVLQSLHATALRRVRAAGRIGQRRFGGLAVHAAMRWLEGARTPQDGARAAREGRDASSRRALRPARRSGLIRRAHWRGFPRGIPQIPLPARSIDLVHNRLSRPP